MTVFYRLFKLFIYVIITPLFVTGVFLFYYQDYSKREILENYFNVARISAGFIRQNVENIALRLDSAGGGAPRFDTQEQKNAARAALGAALKNNPDFVFLALLDADGKEILRAAQGGADNAADNTLEVDFSNDPRLASAAEGVVISGFEDYVSFPVAGFISRAEGGGYIFAAADISSVLRRFTAQQIGRSGGMYFAGAEGAFLPAGGAAAPAVNARDLAAALHSGRALISGLRTAGGKYAGAFTPTALPGVYLIVLQPQKEAYRTINLISWLIAFFILATTTLSYFAALSFSQEVSEPVERITAAAQKIAADDFDVALDPKGAWGEFEILINAVNAMAAGLRHYSALQVDKILDEKKKTDMLARLMRDGVIMCNMEGEQLFINRTAAKILSSDALCAHTLRMPLPEAGRARPQLKDLLTLRSGTVFTYKEHDTQKPAHFEMFTEFFKPANEEQVAVIILRDITYEHEISEMKNDIFNSVAHDLRAPLLGLQAYIMMLREGALPPDKQAAALAAMEQISKTLTGLIENILDASKLERGLLLPDKNPFDICASARKVMDVMAPVASAKGTSLINKIPPAATVEADKNLIERVLSNLVSNAVKFTAGGAVEISYAHEGGFHKIKVSDNGAGIKETELDKIFEKYHRASSGGAKGYGLGLHISRQIINAHGGEITVESREGKGAAFTFTLPAGGLKNVKEGG
ncbi:MAG: HAMP domain-containing protein [Elusimicrobiota bacterium]|jgi:two-component system sensor histidine kinase VicK|nr:HAMP domain-containing protein [Elusimicrobiota bacterium]